MLMMAVVLSSGCKPEEPINSKVPQLETIQVTNITESYALCGGNMIDDGSSVVTDRGICWSKNSNPTIDDSHASLDLTIINLDLRHFTCFMNGLDPNTVYHVRAYAVNGDGAGYGEDVTFTTHEAPEVPVGANKGIFTVNENGKRAFFAQGNLQYQATTNTWRFADKQYDFIGQDNMHCSSTYSGWIDLFAWSTSGYPHGGTSYQPWSTKQSYSDHAYDAYGSIEYNLYDQTGQADWGYNPISNGGNVENQWRTLSDLEWCYIFSQRNTPSGMFYVVAKMNDIKGVILFPDNWEASNYELNEVNKNNYEGFDINIISLTDWNTVFEPNGAVFLPMAGARGDEYFADRGAYWSSSTCNPVSAYSGVTMNETLLLPGLANVRWGGESVRLSQDVQ